MSMLMMMMHSLRRRSVSVRRSVVAALIAVGFLSGCSNANANETVEAQETAYAPLERDRVKRHIYVGLGFGASHLDPDTSGSQIYKVNDRVHSAGSLALGLDLSRHLSIEAQAVDLGRVGFSSGGTIAYQEFSGSALFYVGGDRGRWKRSGLTAFGRIGGGKLINRTREVPYTKANEFHYLLGLGAEYTFRSGLGLRAEAITFDTDINYGQLGLVYRFGKRRQSKLVQTVKADPAPVIEPVVEVPVAVAPVEPVKPVVAAAIPSTVDACLKLNGVLDGVNFHSNSADLTDQSIEILGGVTEKLRSCETTRILVAAHTDSQGSAEYNQALSERRARTVAKFLGSNGISYSRLRAKSFGERVPIDTNETAEGRSRNRRVELRIDVD